MAALVPESTLEHHDTAGLYAQQKAVLAVYTEVYAERLTDPFFSLPRYWERLEGYAARDGFSLLTGRVGRELVCYTMGFTLPAHARWWNGLRGNVDPELLVEDGTRTFGLTEMMVRAPWRRRGYARAMHDALLSNRPEERASLTVRPDNTAAYSAYLSWGWYKLGELQPSDDSPVYDVMVLEMKG